MKALKSKLKNEWVPLNEAEKALNDLGFSIGGNWDYEHGYFDYKLDDEDGYTFIRIPFHAVDGELDHSGTVVQLGEPFLLAHQYQAGLDDHANIGNIAGSFNQFAEPQDPDASIDEKWVQIAQKILSQAETKLLT